jgi:hypothetical protein
MTDEVTDHRDGHEQGEDRSPRGKRAAHPLRQLRHELGQAAERRAYCYSDVSNEPPPPVDARGEDVERLVPLLAEEGCVVAAGAGCADSGVGAVVGCDDSGRTVDCGVTVAAGVTVDASLGAACTVFGRAGAGLVCGRGLAKIATGTAPPAAEPRPSSAGIRARAEGTSNWAPTLALDRGAEVVERPSAKKLPNTTPSNSPPHSQRLVAAALGRPIAGGAKRTRSVASA